MKLSVFERLMLLNILPERGDITTIRIRRELRDALSFSEAEHKELDFESDESGLHWKSDVDGSKDVAIGKKARELIVETLEELSKAGDFTDQHLDVYDRFVK